MIRGALFEGVDMTGPELRPQAISHTVTGGLTCLGLLAALYAAVAMPDSALPMQAKVFMVLALALSVAWTFLVTPKNFVAGFLLGLLFMLIGWRVAGQLGVRIVGYSLLPAIAAFVAQFFDVARADLARAAPVMRAAEWHLAFIRMYIGFDMVPHFTEKLFAGPGPRLDDVKAFAGFGLPMPEPFVIVGGLCELGIAIGIGAGLLTRLAGACATLYFFIATVTGGHFLSGFIWVAPNGGWEYPVLMMVLYLSYSVWGGGAFSLDRVLIDRGWLPSFLRRSAVR